MVRKKKIPKKLTWSAELPLDSVSKIFSYISPLTAREACRLAMVSTAFKMVADSDSVWEKLLPPDYEDLVSRSADDSEAEAMRNMSKKSLYMHLSSRRTIISDGRLSFSLDRHSGKKCFMLRGERFVKKNDVYTTEHERAAIPRSSRFYDIARINMLTEFRFSSKMDPKLLSVQTRYKAYLVFKLASMSHTFITILSKLRVSFKGDNDPRHWVDRDDWPTFVYFQPRHSVPIVPRDRGNGVKEVEIGDFFNVDGERLSPVMCLIDEYLQTEEKESGIILVGVELRPSHG